MNKQWKPIFNMQEYFASTDGYIKRITKSNNTIKEIIYSPLKHNTGYDFIWIYIDGIKFKKYIHRLIAETFIINNENKPCVNHKNGIKTDNRVENLEWCTYSENNKHAYDNKLKSGTKGEKNKNHKKIAQYDLNNNLIKIWNGLRSLSRELNINYSGIYNVNKGKQKTAYGYKWKYII